MSRMTPILIVEDDKGIRDFLSIVLTECGYNVITASNGIEGMAALDSLEIGLVITDIAMPEADGFAVLKKALTINPGIKVIVMSGDITVENYARCFREGAFDFVNKPFGPEMIIKKVRQALTKNE